MGSDRHVHESFVYAAVAFALTAGFGYGAILVSAGELKMPLGVWWIAMVQAHGHAQLFGWSGLFVLGVGLFFIPRLRGTTLARANLVSYALACWIVGITMRTLSQPLGALEEGFVPQGVFLAALAASSIIELAGVGIILVMLITTFIRAPKLGPSAPIRPVLPFLVIAGLSFALAITINIYLSISAAMSGQSVFSASADEALTHIMIYGFVIPIAFAMSVRNLPLYMRLAPPPKQALFPISIAYVTGLVARIIALLEQTFVYSNILGAAGAILEAGMILMFIWLIDIPLRRKAPWTSDRVTPPSGYVEMRAPTRKGYPDHGEFGRFELLVSSAFIWLMFAAGIAICNSFTVLLTGAAALNADIERHSITVGFITLLIFGMAARMLPGFSGKDRVASTRLVMATFWLGNLAALCRVAPLAVPDLFSAQIALAISGVIGWLAVLCLGVNLWMTFRMK